ncbi:MAG TPA: ACT domain-containing protein [Rhodanobacteraceae bacterium]
MSETTGLLLSLAAVEGALRRVLGTVEHRGFRVLACRVLTDAAGQEYRVHMQVEGARDPALLVRQLQRLHDVRDVAVRADAAAA